MSFLPGRQGVMLKKFQVCHPGRREEGLPAAKFQAWACLLLLKKLHKNQVEAAQKAKFQEFFFSPKTPKPRARSKTKGKNVRLVQELFKYHVSSKSTCIVLEAECLSKKAVKMSHRR